MVLIGMLLVSCNLVESGTGNKVDIESPTISVTSHSGGETCRGSITIAGTYKEDLEVDYVQLSFDDGATFDDATFADSEWSYPLDTTTMPDNKYNIIVKINDQADKTSEITILLYFDNHPPLVLVEFPQNYESTFNGEIIIQGKAADKYGVASVNVTSYDAAGKALTRPARFNTPKIARGKQKTADGSVILESKKSFLARQKMITDPTRALASGKESWSIVYNSITDVPTAGEYGFMIVATDFAGNQSTYFFHNEDVKDIAGASVMPYDLHLIDIGDPELPDPLLITKEQLDTLRKNDTTNEFLLQFDQSLDIPTFNFSNPVEGNTAEENAFGANAKAIGMVFDDDGIDTDTLYIQLTGTGIATPTWVQIPPANINGTGLSITWQYDISSLGEGSYTLQLMVEDVNGVPATSNTIPFSIDEGAPTIEITSPLNGSYVSGSFTVEGTADDGDEITEVRLSTDGGSTWDTQTYSGSSHVDWSFNVTVTGDETMSVRAVAEDASGKTASYNIQVICDITGPTISFISPLNTSTVNGIVLLKGTASDNSSIEQVQIRIGKPDSWQTLTGIYNWDYSLDTNSYTDDVYATDIDDDPITEIWEINIQVRASDKAGNTTTVTNYTLKIDTDTDKPTINIMSPSTGQNIAGPALISGTAFDDDAIHHIEMQIDVNGDGDFADAIDFYNGTSGTPDSDTNDKFEDETQWYTINGTTLWTQEINSYGELYETEGGHDGTIIIRIRAVDTKNGSTPDVEGNYQELSIHLDDTIPHVENLNHSSSDYVKGSFTLTGDASDDTYMDYIGISYNGGVSYTAIVDNSTVLDGSKVTKNADNDFDLHVLIDSTSYIPESGILYLRVKVIDDANYQSISYINLNVDNEFPSGTWDAVNVNPDDIRTTSADVQGTATDTGSVSGIDKVEVYFIRGGNVYNPKTGAPDPQGTYDFGDGDGSVPYTTDTNYKITIDNTIEAGNDGGINGDLDGFNESLTRAGSTYTWWAEFNSTNISDGAIDIHYVVFDNAGNADHNTLTGLIANNKPQITGLTVGYDVDDSGAVQTGERFSYSSEFDAANMIYIAISATDANIPLTYEVLHEGTGGNLITAGNSAEIDISGEPEGSTSYLCRVTDSTGVYTTINVEVNIENNDLTDPDVTITPLSLTNVADGHIEPLNESNHDGSDPDVSGIITITGTVSDNRAIESIDLTIGGVGPTTVAQWSGGEIASINGNFVVDDWTFNAAGHTVNWTYTWDTTGITGHAGNNIDIDVEANDFTPNTGIDTLTVDVVPYITDITLDLESGTLPYIKRTALGKYFIAYSNSGTDTIIINGYNLNPNASGVTVGTTALTIVSQDTTNYTWVETRKNTLESGYLTVTTNTIDSTNNSNDNTKTQNDESKTYFPDLNDDRYIAVWQIDSLTGWEGKTEAVMKPNAGRTDMEWMYVDNGKNVYLGNQRLTSSWSLKGGNFARNDDGTFMYIFLHNMNWVSGQTSWEYHGSVQWGKDVVDEGGAYNWHRANTNRLGVGNLSFANDANYGYSQIVMDRYKNLTFITDGPDEDTDNFVAYFDNAAESRSIVFWSYKTGSALAAPDQVTTLAGGWTSNLQKYVTGNTGANYGTTNLETGIRTPYTGIGRTEITSGGNDSEHFAMKWDDTNSNIYLAYFDGTNSALKLAYNTDPVNSPGSWTTRTTSIDTGAGMYVDMAIDPSGGIHLSYYDGARSNLKYAYLPSYNCADGAVEVYTIDALFTNGMYNAINIRDFDDTAGTDYRPIITTSSLSYAGTQYSLRVSWPQNSIGAISDGANEISGNYSGNWEVMTIPAVTAPGQSKTFIETDSTTQYEGQINIGYNGSYLEEARLLDGTDLY